MWSMAGDLASMVAPAGAIAFASTRGVHMIWVVGLGKAGRSEFVRAILIGSLLASAIHVLLRLGGFEFGGGLERVFLGTRIIDWASAVIVAPLLEELLFRGMVLRALLTRFSNSAAVAISAVVFSAFHPSLVGAPCALLLGLVLGVLLVRTGSIWPCIAAHSAWNLTTHLLELSVSAPEVTTDPTFSPLALLLTGVATTVALVAGLLVLARSEHRTGGAGSPE
jgi:membrane protease YdiL (CAAX protease family)